MTAGPAPPCTYKTRDPPGRHRHPHNRLQKRPGHAGGRWPGNSQRESGLAAVFMSCTRRPRGKPRLPPTSTRSATHARTMHGIVRTGLDNLGHMLNQMGSPRSVSAICHPTIRRENKSVTNAV